MNQSMLFKPYTIINTNKSEVTMTENPMRPDHKSESFKNFDDTKLKIISIKYKLRKLFDEHFISASSTVFKNTLLIEYCLTLIEKYRKEKDTLIIMHIKTISEIHMNTGSYSYRSIEEMLLMCNNFYLLEDLLHFFTYNLEY
jgi:hypothetical protein